MFIPALRVSVEGQNQSGKTTFMFSGPKPLVAFTFDQGIERSIYGGKYEMFQDLDIEIVTMQRSGNPTPQEHKTAWQKKDLTIFKLPLPIQLDGQKLSGFRYVWDFFNERIALVAGDDYVQTCGVDTMSIARKVKADAVLEGKQASSPGRERLIDVEYGPVNDAVRDIYSTFESIEKNLIATHHLRDERKDTAVTDSRGNTELKSIPTGNLLLDGYNKTYNHVDVALRFKGETEGIGDKRAFVVKAEFFKCGYVPELKGTEIRNPTWDSLMNWMEMKNGFRLTFPKAKSEGEASK